MAAERPLDKNKDCCFLNLGRVRKKNKSERGVDEWEPERKCY